MAKISTKTGRAARFATTKYDAHHSVLSQTYGALADLRRELSDSKEKVAARAEMLKTFANCADGQRAWLLLEDYFERLSLSRKDFATQDWWPRVLAARGRARLEALAAVFLRARRPVPTELNEYANLERFAEQEQAEQEQKVLEVMEHWMFPPAPEHLDGPRASLRVVGEVRPAGESTLHVLAVRFHLFRPRSGEKVRGVAEIAELATRSGHEQELFAPADWEFIEWLAQITEGRKVDGEEILLGGAELVQWLARWGHQARIELSGQHTHASFSGEVACLRPHLDSRDIGLHFTHRLALPDGTEHGLEAVRFFGGRPALVLVANNFFLLRNAPPETLLDHWSRSPAVPVGRLSARMRTHLRRAQAGSGRHWEELCLVHAAAPEFLFEMSDATVRLRLLAHSERDQSVWQWNGREWLVQPADGRQRADAQPQVLEDPRLDEATAWLRRLDWFASEPGVWVGDANETFLSSLAEQWPKRPAGAQYLGNPAFHRLFLAPRQLRPQIVVRGSGIDWFTVSAEWEQEGLKLSQADLQRLQSATGRFVHLPDAGWVELDSRAVANAHETMADLGVDNLTAAPQRVSLEQVAHLGDAGFGKFASNAEIVALRERLANFKAVPPVTAPALVRAELRPYQQEGFEFLCHLTESKLGGILADDMGLGKTLQTLTWLTWLLERRHRERKPALVICPASVLHNWRREAERFTPHLKVLVLQSGAARHNLRKQIPQHDVIVTNYALLRRDLEALKQFSFSAVVLDEAQFIKNPGAQVTQSVKQLKSDQRLCLTGTPLENRLLDLWSIADFIQPGYLGSQEKFIEVYEPRGSGEEAVLNQRIARRRLSAKLRPLMIRRLKRQVAKDLPDRIEVRHDCELGEDQRKLYLAELRRSREQIQQAVAQQGVAKSRMHVLAALTRLRQICCHPQLVGNDTASGKTDTLFELLEPLLAQGHKVLVFSQFVQMLKLLEAECAARQIPIHLLTGMTKERQEVVQKFQEDTNPCVFLLSLRAAGTGLNLTNASYVVLYDPWWNPAVEAQAIDRSHRIGQTQTVNAYRLIAPGTVEEKIYDLQQRKAQTIADVLGEEGFARSLSQSDLEYLFAEP